MRSVLTEPKDALEARAERKVTDFVETLRAGVVRP